MSTPIDGYRRNHEKTLPDLLVECEKKVATVAADLAEQEEALAWVQAQMKSAKLERPKPITPVMPHLVDGDGSKAAFDVVSEHAA